jgi:hypothetical protein
MNELAEWDSFYVIVGSVAGALVGLQFVVLTLIAERPTRNVGIASAAFLTPTIVHFSVVLLLSALLRVPWHGIGHVALLWGIVAVAGILYSVVVFGRMRHQPEYKPALEDWAFYVALPWIAYAGLAVSAYIARPHLRAALFGVGAASLLLLLIGIHNAWDTVSYHVLVHKVKEAEKSDSA